MKRGFLGAGPVRWLSVFLENFSRRYSQPGSGAFTESRCEAGPSAGDAEWKRRSVPGGQAVCAKAHRGRVFACEWEDILQWGYFVIQVSNSSVYKAFVRGLSQSFTLNPASYLPQGPVFLFLGKALLWDSHPPGEDTGVSPAPSSGQPGRSRRGWAEVPGWILGLHDTN